MPLIPGTPGQDVLIGSAVSDVIVGYGGNDTLDDGGGGPDELIGGTGDDIYVVRDARDTIAEFLNEGIDSIRTTLLRLTLRANVENLFYTGTADFSGLGNTLDNVIIGGAGNDSLFGFDGRDTLVGGAGNDTLDGGTGLPDQLQGGTGDDTYIVDSVDDSIVEFAAEGSDTIRTTLSTYVLNAANVENLTYLGLSAFNGTGNALDNIIIGGVGNDHIISLDGNDRIDGGAGDDVLEAGNGDDVVNGGAGNDSIGGDLGFLGSQAGADILNGDDGNDLIGGVGGNDIITGGNGDDILFGGEGDDLIDGGEGNDGLVADGGNDYLTGGAGNDTLTGLSGTNILQGGIGDDLYEARNSDTIVELPGEGIDRVFAYSTVFTLPANVENLELFFAIESISFTLIGNALDNIIIGGPARDNLFGREGNDTLNDGGIGNGNADTMLGGLGNDLYIVGERGSSTIEYAGEGIDEVRMDFVIYALQANIENLTATGNGLHGALIGNAIDNVIRGGAGIDFLYGREGNDTLIGGSGAANTLFGQEGDDLYTVSAVGDSVIEFAGQGTDTVRTALSSFTLRDNVENLIYTGTGTFIGVGSDGTGNLIQGGAGADQLNGMGGNDMLIGGSGADLLQGGTGADQFRYLGGETGYDRIIDFTSGQDKIALSGTGLVHTAVVDFISTGAPAPTSTNSTFLYDVNTGIVSYDADGTGVGAAVQIAQLNVGQVITAADFIFF